MNIRAEVPLDDPNDRARIRHARDLADSAENLARQAAHNLDQLLQIAVGTALGKLEIGDQLALSPDGTMIIVENDMVGPTDSVH